MIAALYVDPRGCYADDDDIDLWDQDRDARRYDGPHPVVAHPPCSRWCQLAGLVQARWGHRIGDDGGCFKAALEAVRKWGGVLEHPAYSKAWPAHDLLAPVTGGGWTPADFDGGWTCYVEQCRYGHPARKATWLYAHSVDLPSLRWGHAPVTSCKMAVSWCNNRTWAGGEKPRVGKKAASATPPEFRDVLVSMAQSVYVSKEKECFACRRIVHRGAAVTKSIARSR